MNLLIKNASIIDPQGPHHQKQADIYIEQGRITQIGKVKASEQVQVIDAQGAFICPGFFDMNCAAGDPGIETREDITSLVRTAQAGGFTGLALLPHTNPVIDSKSQVEYVLNKSKNLLVDVLPVGAISQKREGKELAELYDMQQAGAVAFSDGDRALNDDGFMNRAMQYGKGIEAFLMVFPENKSIAGKAQVHESMNSVLMGMKGLPALAEEMHVARDIFLAKYNDTAIHFNSISTAGALSQIKKAKKEGLKVSCDVTVAHLCYTESVLADFDSLYKIKPPLRSKEDQKALIAGLKDGTIDAISTQHRPEEVEFKNVEFEIAHFGMLGLQTAVSSLLEAGLALDLIVEKLSIAPRRLLGLHLPQIAEGQKANLTLVHPQKEWTYSEANNLSNSKNSPVMGKTLKAKVLMSFNNNQVFIND